MIYALISLSFAQDKIDLPKSEADFQSAISKPDVSSTQVIDAQKKFADDQAKFVGQQPTPTSNAAPSAADSSGQTSQDSNANSNDNNNSNSSATQMVFSVVSLTALFLQ